MEKILFKEEQRFGSVPLYLSMGVIYVGTIAIFAYGLYKQLVLGEPYGNKPMSDNGLIITAIGVLGVLFLSGFFLFSSKLKVKITNKSLSFTFKPMIIKTISYSPKDIVRFEVREYKPVKEYGGWGIKQGKKSVGRAYNVRGNIGLQLYLEGGKKVLIGTQRKDAIGRAMNKMMETRKDG